ncbi:MAG: O-antigen ligase family protein [Anaerolineae bacterium]
MIEWRSLIQDLIQQSPLRRVYFNRQRWLLVALAFLSLAVMTVGGGWLIAEFGALAVAALVAGMVYILWALQNMEAAFLGVIAIVTLLPFGSLPFRIGFVPTFLDLTLLALFGVWVLNLMLSEEQEFIATPVGAAITAFALLAIVAFVAGLSHGALTSYLIRHFAEVLLSIALFFLVVNTVQDVGRLRRLMRWLILGAAMASLVGIGLYLVPEAVAIRALSALGRFGYPTGQGVLRYVRDDPELMKRATSTSVDPNVLGSLLNLTLAMLAPQLVVKRPVFPRLVAFALAGVIGIGLVLTVSRSAMFGVALAVLIISLLRYRKLLPLIGLVLLAFLLSPWSQGLIEHFVEGFLVEDLSTQMRMGEYKDTFILIRRYPFLGVGFAGAPDIDIYVAVASVYLIVAAQMGLVGLAAFVVILGMVFWRFWQRRSLASTVPALEPLWYGLHAALIGGAISGVFDHFFFSLDFHHSVTLFWLIVGLATASTELLDGLAPEPT